MFKTNSWLHHWFRFSSFQVQPDKYHDLRGTCCWKVTYLPVMAFKKRWCRVLLVKSPGWLLLSCLLLDFRIGDKISCSFAEAIQDADSSINLNDKDARVYHKKGCVFVFCKIMNYSFKNGIASHLICYI